VDPAIDAHGIEKAFGRTRAVAGATLRVGHGELVALLGQLVAGAGAWVEPEHRRIGMVFQDGALFPHLTVAGNVAFGASRPERVSECLELVGLGDRARSYPHELSGGESQRVALARALAADPEVVLLDEPFAALDAGLRDALRSQVVDILRRAGTSALLVTHDQAEALSLAGTVAVMRAGRIEQVGTPEEIYERPRSRWLAEFLGEADVLPGTASDGVVECELGRFGAGGELTGRVDVVIRPESIAIGTGPAREPHAEAIVVKRSFYGHDQLVHLELPSGLQLRSRRLGFPAWHPGDRVRVWIDGPVSAVAPED
jgi:iron(III) transport system ATP-binding protein